MSTKARQCPPSSPPRPPRMWAWKGDKSKKFYFFNIHEIKVQGMGAERERGFVGWQSQGSSEPQKRPLAVVALGCLQSVPTLAVQAGGRLKIRVSQSPGRFQMERG